ncbi:MoaD/ThiS family protein [Acetobacter oeni]|uniref:Molybdopterin synthase sulfur carrier subunit n=1 Tax=Acetobacter oeni TaxID=304077 RepID=A0A511XNG5_9PROT|nr:MoaD/ThiS family protein [Acetobacter oeni]MBB3884328.1 molybdopterin converting factor small subunit [Acetobacter oeni]NHO20317.1 molybdopterin synthase sulfur carrier subunit [Acetobacter oeni]GBR05223.1 molybdopterin converting factor small subunit [Acetobacter oeni LMG 21952]GEN64494.1 molybdopterin synthase sulfur carrier subunit [Acetobacter oeni]
MPHIELEYFAQLGDVAGRRAETRETVAGTAAALYDELRKDYGFALPSERMRVAVNAVFRPWDQELHDGDHVVFIPPVSGG